MKEFSSAVDESGRISLDLKERSFSAIEEYIHDDLGKLSTDLDKVDHWYIRSSPEFKNIKNHLETIQKEWKDMGSHSLEYKQNKLRSQMEALSDYCDRYINNKNKKEQEEGLNEAKDRRNENT